MHVFLTNPDLPDILGRTDFDFENFYLFGFFLDPKFPEFQFPDFQISRNLAWAHLGPTLDPAWARAWAQARGFGPGLGPGLGPLGGPGGPRVFSDVSHLFHECSMCFVVMFVILKIVEMHCKASPPTKGRLQQGLPFGPPKKMADANSKNCIFWNMGKVVKENVPAISQENYFSS